MNRRHHASGNHFLAVTVGLLLFASRVLAQFGGVDSTFKPGGGNSAGFDLDVLAVALQSDGRIVVGGAFTQDGRTSRNGVARLNSDGTLDTSFDPGTGANSTVQALALQPDGKVVAIGRFTTVNGAPHRFVARLNSNGTVDSLFNPQADDLAFTGAALPDGGILVGGAFTSISGVPRGCVARLNTDGSVAADFLPAIIADNTVFYPSVQSLCVQADGRVVIGGQFTDVGGSSRNGIARLNEDGSLDTTFDPGTGANKTVNALALQADGRIIVGGDFTNFNGATRYYVARLNINGSVDPTFTPHIDPVTGGVITVGVAADGKILVGGDFASVEGQSRNDIVRLNPDGSLDTTFDPGTGPSTPNEIPRVRAIACQPDGKMVVGGGFTTFGGVKLNYIARLVGDQGGTIEFSNGAYNVDEAGGSANLAVRRTGSLIGSVSISYASSDGTATAGADYMAKTGTLIFAPGETNRIISIPIVPDALVEGNETVIVTLGNPIGGVIVGSTPTSTIIILDNTAVIPPRFTSIAPAGATQLRLTLTSQAGRTYILQSTTNFPDWVPTQTNIAVGDSLDFLESRSATFDRRFYRALGK